MKKFLIYTMIIAALAAGLTACNGTVTTSGNISPAPSGKVQTTPAQITEQTAQPVKESDKNKTSEIIKVGRTADISGMVKTYSGAYDINSDGVSDNISLYVDAQKDENGILMLEDSQKWVLEVNDGISAYTLFDANISNGSLYLEIAEYYEGDKAIPTLSLIKSSGASLSITNYTYNKDAEGFAKSEVFSTDTLSPDGINKIASSLPEPEAVN